MAEKFDPHYVWLSIAPEEQPPTLYRLLGLRPFEDNLDVIKNAADRQMTHLRTFQSGKHSEDSQKLLNQVASAKLTLLKPDKKAEYDKVLREQMDLASSESVLDEESSLRQEELSMTLVGFLKVIEAEKEAEGKPGDFDPYETWLAIAPEQQPPTLYRLLGLRPLEDNRNTIKDAAKRRMSHLREFVSDEHGSEAQKLLSQVSSARLTLLNRKEKTDYDKLLRQRMTLEDEGSQPEEELSTTLAGFLGAVRAEEVKPSQRRKHKRREAAAPVDKAGREQRFMIGAAIGVGVLLLLVIAVLAWKLGATLQPEEAPSDVRSTRRVRIEDCTAVWRNGSAPCDPTHSRCKVLKQNPYTLGFEDWTDNGYDDLCLQFTHLANGDIEITVVGLNSSQKFTVVAPDGKVIPGLVNLSGKDVGKKGILKGSFQ